MSEDQSKVSKKPNTMVSYYQINELENSRPKHQLTLEYTPTGPQFNRANLQEFLNRNAGIDDAISDMRERLDARRGKAREAFELAKKKGKARDAFNRSR